MSARLEALFGVQAAGSTLRREARAGLATFLTMAYILVVNPEILGQAIRVPNAFPQLLFATAVAAAFGSILMGLLARYPYAQAPGMGLNAYFAFTVVLGLGIPWQTALGAIFIDGVLFMVLSLSGVREAIINALPPGLKYATSAGVGFFLALIGLKTAGIIVAHPATLVTLGNLRAPSVLVAAAGLLLTTALLARRVAGAVLYGILLGTVLALLLRLPLYPGAEGKLVPFAGFGGAPLRLPIWPRDLLLALDLRGALRLGVWGILFTFLFVEIFDAAGTLIGLSSRAGFLDERGQLPRAGRAFFSDALATALGALLGTSTTTVYIESAAGIEEGGRTGLTAVVVGVLFLLSLFFWPLLAAVPGAATAPALIVVGALMMGNLRRIAWEDPTEALPALLTVVMMPLTFSIANGVSFGVLSYVGIRLLTRPVREVHPVLGGLAALLLLRYAWIGGE